MFMVRLRSSVIIMAATILFMVLGGYPLFFFLLGISCIGLMELYRAVAVHRSLPAVLGYMAAAAFYLTVLFDRADLQLPVMVGFLLLLLSVYVFAFPKYNSEQISMVYFGLFYVSVLMSYIYRVRMLEGGAYLVWLIFIGAWGSDTCAYLVGRWLGKHKVAPKLSPKKTVEGCIGGVLGAALIGLIYGAVFRSELSHIGNPMLIFAVTGACSSVLSMVGDMAASGIKRNKDIKDYGRLIPGHGGILDRVDSILVTAPVVYYLIELLK